MRAHFRFCMVWLCREWVCAWVSGLGQNEVLTLSRWLPQLDFRNDHRESLSTNLFICGSKMWSRLGGTNWLDKLTQINSSIPSTSKQSNNNEPMRDRSQMMEGKSSSIEYLTNYFGVRLTLSLSLTLTFRKKERISMETTLTPPPNTNMTFHGCVPAVAQRKTFFRNQE